MRKTLLTVLAALCVLGSVAGSLGATFPDTEGTKYEGPVALLSALGILTGFPDGTFKPADSITRAQFAAIAVRAMGLEGVAAMAKGPTKFTDVAATHWASGYINVAADQRLIEGYPGGTYQPERKVTYAESLTILVRMLGYGPVVTGTWPTSYLVKAYGLGVSSGIAFDAGGSASRGDVALFVHNSLTVHLMEQSLVGGLPVYTETDKTLLEDKLGYTSGEGYVTDVSSLFLSGLADGRVKIGSDIYSLASGAEWDDAWLGLKVQVWTNADGAIVLATVLTPPSSIVTGFIEDVWATGGGRFLIDGETYDVASPFYRWSNNVEHAAAITTDDVDFLFFEARAVVGADGKLVSLVAQQFPDSLFLTDVNPPRGEFTGIRESAATFEGDLDDYTEWVIRRGDEPASLEDLREDDVVHYFVTGGGHCLWMEAYANQESGELQAVSTGGEDFELTLDGDDYVLAKRATISGDNNVSFAFLDLEADIAPFVGENVTLYLDRDGNVRHIAAGIAAPPEETVGVVKTEFYVVPAPDPTDPDRYYVKVLRADGAEAKLELDDETRIDGVGPVTGWITTSPPLDAMDGHMPPGTLVEYSLDGGGLLEAMDTVDPDHTIGAFVDTVQIRPDENMVGSNRVASGAKFFDTGAWKARSWSEFKTMNCSTDPIPNVRLYDGGDLTLEWLVYNSTGETITYGGGPTEVEGVVVSRSVVSGGTKVKILTVDGVVEYLVDSSTTIQARQEDNHGGGPTAEVGDLDAGDFVVAQVSGTKYTSIGEWKAKTWFAALAYAGYVKTFSEEDMILTVQDDPDSPTDEEDLILDPDLVVYDVSGTPTVGDTGDLITDALIQGLDLDGDSVIDVIKIME